MEEECLIKYLTVNNAYQPKVIPNKDAFTFLSKKSGTSQVWKYSSSMSHYKRITDFNNRVTSVYHSNSGENTIVGVDYQGNEKKQFFLLTENGEFNKIIFSPDHFHYFGGWSPDEKKICFSSNRRSIGCFDIYIYDIKSKREEIILKTNKKCVPLCWSKNGDQIIYSIQNTNIDNSLYILDIKGKTSYKIGDKNKLARYQWLEVVTDSYQPPELTNDGSGGYLLSDINRETLGVYKFSFDNPDKLEKLFAIKDWDIEEIKLSPNEQYLAYTVNQGGISRLKVYEFQQKHHYDIKDIPNGVVNSLSWLDNEYLVFCLKSATLTGDIWKLSIDNMKTKRITFFGINNSIQKLWQEPELYNYSSFDGLKIPYFYYGKKEKNHPVVVYVHGGPEHQSRSEYHPVIQYLVSKGYGVVAPNVRGSMGYGRTYVQLDDKRNRLDAVTDLAWLVKDIIKNHKANPEKIGIMGRSYGGFMVLASLTQFPNIWSAGVNIVGISHFRTFLENTGPWRRKLRECEYGSLEKDTNFFEKIAPLNHTSKINAPLLIFHGRNDTRVPVSEAEQLYEHMKRQDKISKLIVFEDEGHQTEKIENHIKMNKEIVKFFQSYL